MTIIRSPYPDVPIRDLSITELVFAGIDPAQAILIDGPTGREVTGAQFIGGVKALAGGLTARGYAPGGCVALMAPNIPEFCTVFHAVAWAGGTVTTVNPTYTAHELRHQLNDAGAELLVLECVPNAVAAAITAELQIPVIGIGAGVACDGQVLVMHDMLGVAMGRRPRFVKDFLGEGGSIRGAIRAYIDAVRDGSFPDAEHSYES